MTEKNVANSAEHTGKMSQRLMDADVLIEWINGIYDCCDIVFPDNDMCKDNADCNSCRWFSTLQAVKTKINNMPTIDAVPVVRCKDCKHWGKHDDVEVPGETDHVKACEWAFWMVGENGFCVYGERDMDA